MSDLLAPGMAARVRALARPGTLIVLDFDGTLAPIVGDREAASLGRRARSALRRLARRYPVAILSGRGADDVRSRLGGAEVRWVVGSGGAEWPGEEGRHRAWRRRVRGWQAALARRLAGMRGIEVEAKPLSVAVHYRHSPEPERAAERIVRLARRLRGAERLLGDGVVNLLPAGAGDKGTALQRLARLAAARRVLFVGDDATDEAAFGAALGVPGVMVRVGRDSSSRAEHWLARRSAVDVLLERLIRLRPPLRPRATRARPAVATPRTRRRTGRHGPR
ncbi:MAG TPA: trehalose-phosphatase [Anaeromyxobacter sp.]|nr:trehalose-phosphatase [Anaeromyxobacter sp.]